MTILEGEKTTYALARKTARLVGECETYKKLCYQGNGENTTDNKERKTYAKALTTQHERLIQAARSKPIKWQKSNTVLIYPDDDKETSTNTEKIIGQQIDATTLGIQVKSKRGIARGGLKLEFARENDKKTFVEEMKKKRAEVKARVEEPKVNRCRLILYDVERCWSAEQIRERINRQNFGGDEVATETSLKFCFRQGPKEGSIMHWVMEATPETRLKLMEKRQIYLGYTRHTVRDFIAVTRCYQCHKYGHPARYCRGDITCGHCAKIGHDAKDCTDKDADPRRINCITGKQRQTNHEVTDRNRCKSYKLALQAVVQRT